MDAQTSTLYNACKASLYADAQELENNYCYQMISAVALSLYTTRHVLAAAPPESETNCEIKKYSALQDIKEIPPRMGDDFSHTEIARTFVRFIDSGAAVQEFPWLTSFAERAFAQMLWDWDKLPRQEIDEVTRAKEMAALSALSSASSKPDSLKLLKSCENYAADNTNSALCSAAVGGFLIVHSLAQKHTLPVYSEPAPCFKEKNEFLKEFTQKRLGCFPAGVDLKKDAARKIVKIAKQKIETSPEDKRGNAIYSAVSLLTRAYTCRN